MGGVKGDFRGFGKGGESGVSKIAFHIPMNYLFRVTMKIWFKKFDCLFRSQKGGHSGEGNTGDFSSHILMNF